MCFIVVAFVCLIFFICGVYVFFVFFFLIQSLLSKAQGIGSSSVKLRVGSLFMNVGKSEKQEEDIRQTPHVNINPFTPDSMFLHNSEGKCRRRKRMHWNE